MQASLVHLAVDVDELGHAGADAVHDVPHRRGVTNEVGGEVQRVPKHVGPVAMRSRRDHTPREHLAIGEQHETAGRFRAADIQTDSRQGPPL